MSPCLLYKLYHLSNHQKRIVLHRCILLYVVTLIIFLMRYWHICGLHGKWQTGTLSKQKKKKRFPVSSDFNYSDFNLLLISSTQHSWHSNERKIQTRDQKIQPSIFWAKLPGIQDPWSLNSLLIHWVVCRKSSQILFSHHEAQREPPVPPLCAPHEVCSTSRLVTVSY